MSNYFQDLGDGGDSMGIPFPIRSPGTVVVAQIQAQANRLIPTYTPRLSELPLVIDGLVGPKTTAALQKIAGIEAQGSNPQGRYLLTFIGSASSITQNATTIRDALSIIANANGQAPALFAPFVVPPGQPVPPIDAPPGTPGLPEPGMSMTTIMIGAVALGVLWALSSKSSRKGRKR